MGRISFNRTHFAKLAFVGAVILSAVGCNNGGGKSSNSVATSQYQYLNGVCYSVNNGTYTPVQNTYCQGNTNNVNGQCIGTYWYFYQQYNQWQQVQCNGANCRGYTLYNQQGQQVYCQ